MTHDLHTARAVYARLWADAQAQFATGTVKTDPYLDRRESDTRRGLTLVLRPDGEAKARITAALDELGDLAPGQYRYHPDELHITVLSVISAAPDAVFVYGESDGDALNLLRERVRESLRAAGLAEHLERRYRSVTAHMTVLRFRSTPAKLPALVAYLEQHRQHDLGAFTARQIDFVSNDWYMSRDIVRVLHRYTLAAD